MKNIKKTTDYENLFTAETQRHKEERERKFFNFSFSVSLRLLFFYKNKGVNRNDKFK